MAKKSHFSKEAVFFISFFLSLAWDLVFGVLKLFFKFIAWAVKSYAKNFSTPQESKRSRKSARFDLKNQKVLKDNLALSYQLDYSDVDGDVTTRDVEIKRILGGYKSNGEPFVQHLDAYCHLRKEPRSFRIDRIRSLTDLETGLVVEGGHVIRHFIDICERSV